MITCSYDYRKSGLKELMDMSTVIDILSSITYFGILPRRNIYIGSYLAVMTPARANSFSFTYDGIDMLT